MTTYFFDHLEVQVYESRNAMGKAAAEIVAETITSTLRHADQVRIIFAAAPSQNEFLRHLVSDKTIDWKRVFAFHMDEYVGLPADAEQSFGNFLSRHLFQLVPMGAVHYLNGNATNKSEEAARYAKLLQEQPIDIVCLGIGENTHIAFNDPHVARFDDPEIVKLVSLDLQCRQQQVNDGCFKKLGDVPEHALTLTIPALFNAKHLFCMVPGARKAEAVQHTVHAPISEKYPSTILRRHSSALMFLDDKSSAEISTTSFVYQKNER